MRVLDDHFPDPKWRAKGRAIWLGVLRKNQRRNQKPRVNRPLTRPYFLGGCWHWGGGPLRFFHEGMQKQTKSFRFNVFLSFPRGSRSQTGGEVYSPKISHVLVLDPLNKSHGTGHLPFNPGSNTPRRPRETGGGSLLQTLRLKVKC